MMQQQGAQRRPAKQASRRTQVVVVRATPSERADKAKAMLGGRLRVLVLDAGASN
jgi:hypothetical protein